MKYPIVLVHGIILKDFKYFRSFGALEKLLKGEGYKVYTAQIDGVGTVEHNAAQLKNEILRILEAEKTEKVNIIAHSKGGLDTEYMLEHLEMEGKVASFTALCSPFQGSPIANWVLKLPRWMISCIAFYINLIYRIFGDECPDALEACKELKEHSERKLLPYSSHFSTYVQSYSSSMKQGKKDFIMGIPLAFSKHIEPMKDTDGLVPEESAVIGEYKGNAVKDDSVSHSEIVDFMVTEKRKKEKIYAFYRGLCTDLEKRGF